MCKCWTKVKRMFSCKNKKKKTEKPEKPEEKAPEESHDSAGTPADNNKNSAVEGDSGDSGQKGVEKYQFTKVLLGQPDYTGIKDPKDCLRKILETERPDLVPVGCALDDRELRLLDGHLTQKGELRGGISLTEGWKSSVYSSTEVGEGADMKVVLLYAKGRFGAVYMIHTELGLRALKIPLRMYASKRMEQEIAMMRYLFKMFTDQFDKFRLDEEIANTSQRQIDGAKGEAEKKGEVKEVKKKKEERSDEEEDKSNDTNGRDPGGTDNRDDNDDKKGKKGKKEKKKPVVMVKSGAVNMTALEKEDKELNHLVGIVDHGMNGGTPYLIMPLCDASLGKIRQELEVPIRQFEIFYLGQEAIVGLKQCYSKGVIHRDFKPTNLLLSVTNNLNWLLCDFGEACRSGETRHLSYPDYVTLPYMSRMAHETLVKPVPATVWWDLESWFYFLLEFFVPLPWMGKEVEEVYKMKQEFWSDLDGFLAKNSASILPEFVPIAKFIEARKPDPEPHSKLTGFLRIGYSKYMPKNFDTKQFVWIEKRKKSAQLEEKEKGGGGVSKAAAPKSQKSQKSQKSRKQKSQKSNVPKSRSPKSKSQKSKIQKSKSQKSKNSRSQKSKIQKSRSPKSKNSQVQKTKSQSKSQKSRSQMSKTAEK